MGKLIIASNRLPVTLKKSGESLMIQASNGGLATGMASLTQSENVRWVGWHGLEQSLYLPQHAAVIQSLEDQKLCPIDLEAQEIDVYYNQVSNAALWPLYHYQVERMPLELDGWKVYERVNARFAAAIEKIYEPGDTIWVHDYHLQVLPRLLREKLPDAPIGFFLHIPFPSSEVFRILPWRKEILEGLLGADLIGFHVHAYARHFCSSVLRIVGTEAYGDTLNYQGRKVRVSAFPLGVDVQGIAKRAGTGTCPISEAIERLRAEGAIEHIMLAIDRMDYTKGLTRRLIALERLLDRSPHLRGKLVYVQIAAPSRDDVPAYKKCRRQVEELIGRINGKYGMPGYQPIHYIARGFSQKDVVTLYRQVDVMVVTPLRDGMNLVAKEFIAARTDEDGVLVLSEFAGAAVELGEAVLVNPYDIADTAQGFLQAIEMASEERRDRMKALRQRISLFDAGAWARQFVALIKGSSVPQQQRQEFSRPQHLASMVPAQKIVLFLDYDGTLFPIVRIPHLARPDASLLTLLRRLSEKHDVEVHIVSGRSQEALEMWLSGLNVHLHAEHGAMSRHPNENEWTSALATNSSEEWKPFVRSVLEDFCKNTPGSFIEEKKVSLAWHYRMADPEHSLRMASELRLHSRETFAPMGLETIQGKRVVEVRRIGINKGVVIKNAMEQQPKNTFCVTIGDDSTDEDMFTAVGDEGLTIVVGDQPSQARFRLRDPAEVRQFLEMMAAPAWGCA